MEKIGSEVVESVSGPFHIAGCWLSLLYLMLFLNFLCSHLYLPKQSYDMD